MKTQKSEPNLKLRFVILIALLSGCTDNRPEIYKLKYKNFNSFASAKTEYYVISNAPRIEAELIDYVASYNKLNSDSSDYFGCRIYQRVFFREGKIDQDYEEDSIGYTTEFIDDNWEDILIEFVWRGDSLNSYSVRYSLWKDGAPYKSNSINLHEP